MLDRRGLAMTAPHAALPPFPRVAASAAVFRDGEVLLIRRGSGTLAGYWSLPGGHVEPGEPSRETARREVAEETHVDAEIRHFLDLHEVILRDDAGLLRAHYLIAVYVGLWRSGEPMAGDDAAAAGFFTAESMADLQLTDGAARLIDQARARLFSDRG